MMPQMAPQRSGPPHPHVGATTQPQYPTMGYSGGVPDHLSEYLDDSKRCKGANLSQSTVNGNYRPHTMNPSPIPQSSRPAHDFAGYPNHPPPPHTMSSMAPQIPDTMGPHHLSHQHAATIGPSTQMSGSALSTRNPSERTSQSEIYFGRGSR